jgi:hypothetical protein
MANWSRKDINQLKSSPNDWAWDDLRFPAQGINPPGLGSDPTLDSATGLLLFGSGPGTETIAGVAQMPHDWAEGTELEPHVHWQKTTSATGNVLWKIDYEVVNNGDVALMTYASTLSRDTVVGGTPDNNTANETLITDLGRITMKDKRISCLIFWKVARVGGDTLDTYAADARMIEFDIHYQRDSDGSYGRFFKLNEDYRNKKGKPKDEFRKGAW